MATPDTVGSGKDFSDLAAWEADAATGSSAETYTAQCFGNVGGVTINGWVNGSSCVIEADSTQQHDGVNPAYGAYIPQGGAIVVSESNNVDITITGLGFQNYTDDYTAKIVSSHTGGQTVIIERCIFAGDITSASTATFTDILRISGTASGDTVHIRSCLFRLYDSGNSSTGHFDYIGCGWSTGDRDMRIYNNTFICKVDISSFVTQSRAINCYCSGDSTGSLNTYNNLFFVAEDDWAGDIRFDDASSGVVTHNSDSNYATAGFSSTESEESISASFANLFEDSANKYFALAASSELDVPGNDQYVPYEGIMGNPIVDPPPIGCFAAAENISNTPLGSDVVFHVEADTRVQENDGKVSIWQSMVDAKRLTQGTAANRPVRETLNDEVGIIFDGNDDFLDLPPSLTLNTQACTIFVLFRNHELSFAANNESWGGLWAMEAGTAEMSLHLSNDGEVAIKSNTTTQQTTMYSSVGNQVAVAAFGASNAKAYLGRESSVETAGAGNDLNGGWVGKLTSSDVYLTGRILAIVVCNKQCSDAEVESMLDYFNSNFNVLHDDGKTSATIAGDSRVEGKDGGGWPDYFWPAHTSYLAGHKIKVNGIADGGDSVQTDLIGNLTNFNTIITSQSGYINRLAVFVAGINDVTADRTEVQIEGDIDTWIASVRSNDPGAIVVGFTIPTWNSASYTSGRDAIREGVNDYILNGADFDHVVDIDSLSEFSDPNDTTYFDSDKVHFSAEGDRVVAQAFYNLMQSQGWVGGGIGARDRNRIVKGARSQGLLGRGLVYDRNA